MTYGFMAADQVQAPYQLRNKPLALSPQTIKKVRNSAAIRRAWSSTPAARSPMGGASGITSRACLAAMRWSPRAPGL